MIGWLRDRFRRKGGSASNPRLSGDTDGAEPKPKISRQQHGQCLLIAKFLEEYENAIWLLRDSDPEAIRPLPADRAKALAIIHLYAEGRPPSVEGLRLVSARMHKNYPTLYTGPYYS